MTINLEILLENLLLNTQKNMLEQESVQSVESEHSIQDIDALQQHGINAADINKIKGSNKMFSKNRRSEKNIKVFFIGQLKTSATNLVISKKICFSRVKFPKLFGYLQYPRSGTLQKFLVYLKKVYGQILKR